MDQDFTIQQVGVADQWPGSDGTMMATYPVMFQGQVEAAHITRPANAPPPAMGEQLTGSIGPKNQWDRRPFKKAKPAGGRGGGQGGGRSPEDQRSIVRQHSQEMALRAIELGATFGVIGKPDSSKGLMVLVGQMADWFEKDAAPVRQTPAVKAQGEIDRVEAKFNVPLNGVNPSMPVGAVPDPDSVPF